MITLDEYAVKRNITLEDYDTSVGESLSASAQQTWIENPTSALSRLFSLTQAKPERYEPGMVGDYSPEKAFRSWVTNDKALEQTQKAGVTLEIPEQGIAQEKLDILIERKREEIKRQAVIAAGPQGAGMTGLRIGTALAVSLADPINIASAFVPVVSAARQARMAKTLGRTGGRVATGTIEGAVGAAIVEPLIYKAMTAEQADYDLYDSYMNVAIGGVLGGGLHAGLGKISDVISQRGAQDRVDLLRAAVGQAMDNKPIDVTRVADEMGVSRSITAADARNAEIEAIRAELEPRAVMGLDAEDVATLRTELETLKAQNGDAARIKQIEDSLSLDADARKASDDLAKLDAGVIPKDYRARVQAVEDANAQTLHEPKDTAHSPQADPETAKFYDEKLKSKPEETPETVDQLTDDVITALDEQGIDTAQLKADIAEINTQIDKESTGLREAILCRIG